MGTRRKFSAEFKREAVALTGHPDVSVAQVARDLGIGANLLGRWRRELHADGAKAFRGTVPRPVPQALRTKETCNVFGIRRTNP